MEFFLIFFIIFVSLSCVSAEDTPSLGDSTPTYYDVSDDSYSSYFTSDGVFNADVKEGDVSVVRLGNLTSKSMVFNKPNLVITSSEGSFLNGGNITLGSAASGSQVSGVTIATVGTAITNYASNVYLTNNNIGIFSDSLGGIYSVGASNVFITGNTFFMNVTSPQTYAIGINSGEGLNSFNYNITGNVIQGINSAGYMLGVYDEGGLSNSIISENNFQLIGPVVYCILTNTNSNSENATGNLMISTNTIYVNGDLAYAILNVKNAQVYNLMNNITVVSNGGLGISSIELYDSTIYANTINIRGGRLTSEYPLIVPIVNTGIRIYGTRNIMDNNIITGTNVDGISANGPMNIVSYNTIQLTNDDGVSVDSQGLSQLVAISESSSTNNIIGNRILIEGNTTFAHGVYIYNGQEDVTNFLIENNTIMVRLNNIYGVGINGIGLSSSIINHNNILTQTAGYGFGIYSTSLPNNMSQVLIITNNTILASGGEVRSIELINSYGNTVVNNNLTATGDSVYGVALGNVLYTLVDKNSIVTQAGTLENVRSTDYIPSGQAAIRLYNNNDNNQITNNVFEGLTNVNNTDASGTYLIENNTHSLSVYILASNTVIPLTGGNFTGNVIDVFTNPLIGHHVYINLTRVSSGASKVYDVVIDYQGIFTLPISLARGEYTAQISYLGGNIGGVEYEPAQSPLINISVTDIEDNRTSTWINASNLEKKEGESGNFIGTIQDSEGNMLIGHHVSVTLTRVSSGASKTYDVVSDYTGIFSLEINLGKGEYTAEVTYAGTDKYKPSSTQKLTITVN